MADEPENLILEHLRAIRADLSEVRRRLANLEAEGAVQSKHIAALVDGQANTRTHFSEIELRLDRIERRLDLAPA